MFRANPGQESCSTWASLLKIFSGLLGSVFAQDVKLTASLVVTSEFLRVELVYALSREVRGSSGNYFWRCRCFARASRDVSYFYEFECSLEWEGPGRCLHDLQSFLTCVSCSRLMISEGLSRHSGRLPVVLLVSFGIGILDKGALWSHSCLPIAFWRLGRLISGGSGPY